MLVQIAKTAPIGRFRPGASPTQRASNPNGPSDVVELSPAEDRTLTRKALRNSFIVMLDKAGFEPSQSTADRVLGSTRDTVFLLTDSPVTADKLQDSGAVVFKNYEYQGQLFDEVRSSELPIQSSDMPRHLGIIDADVAWQVTKGLPEVVSAVTDTGLDVAHPQLAGTLWQNPSELVGNGVDDDSNGKIDDHHGWDFSDNDNDAGDETGSHHTHVFGLVHAQSNDKGVAGVAPRAKGMALRIAGGKRRFSSAVMVESYLYALANGAKSINTSFNIDGFVGDRAIEAIYRKLSEDDILLFNSAGNKGKKNPRRGVFEDIVLVAATGTQASELDKRSDFSNYGAAVDIAAPGSQILSTLPGERVGSFSGTSMASPLVLGVDLLLQSAHPEWNRAQRWAQIAGTADKIEHLNPQFTDELGFGRLNAGRALTESLPAPTITPKLTTFPNGQTMNVRLRFDKVLEPELANHENAWRITNEKGETVRSGSPKEIRLMTNEIDFNVADLPAGSYTLIGSAAHLLDPFGQPLDGNKDGESGDDLVVNFQRIS